MHINELRKLSDDDVLKVLKEAAKKLGDSFEYAEINDIVFDVLCERHGKEHVK